MHARSRWSVTAATATLALAASMLTAATSRAEEAPKQAVSPITRVAPDPNWAETQAYTLGVQAYVFAFPWYYNQLLRYMWSQPEKSPFVPSNVGTNAFWHSRQMSSAEYRDGGTPNNDTPYSMAFVDVSREPVILSVPAIKDRYYSVQLTGFDSDNFAYVGTRTTGKAAGHFAIVGPDWKGQLPAGVQALPPSHTGMVIAVVRIMALADEVSGKTSMAVLNRLQDQFTLTPLSARGKPAGAAAVAATKPWPPYPAKDDPLADWKTINRAMTEIPPPARHSALVREFAQIGIGPGQDVEKVDEATRRGLIRALEDGKKLVTGAAAGFARATAVNGWRRHSAHIGRFGEHADFVGRAGPQSMAGIVAHDNAEGMYFPVSRTADGEPLSGAHRYVLRFGRDEIPPVDAFWSLTAYGMDQNFMRNPLQRYSLGDRSALARDPDGGVTLYVQRDSPGPQLESNWLPVGDERFKLVLRLYLPRQPVLDGTWRVPELRRAD